MHIEQLVKYLRGESNPEETEKVFFDLDEILRKEDQATLDSFTASIETNYSDLMDDWVIVRDVIFTQLCKIKNQHGQDLLADLFLIPIIINSHTESQCADDLFEIGKLGQIRQQMVDSGFISNEDNIGILTRLLSFNEISRIKDTTKMQILKQLVLEAI